MSARQDRTPQWVRAVTSDPHIREVYEDNAIAATKAHLAGRVNQTELDVLQWMLKQRAVRRHRLNQRHAMRQPEMRRAA
jgi:hypothetical protein